MQGSIDQAGAASGLNHWFSPFPLAAGVGELLERAGFAPAAAAGAHSGEGPQGHALLLYDTPERLVSACCSQQHQPPAVETLRTGLCQVLEASRKGQPAISGWRLEQLGAEGLRHWLQGTPLQAIAADPPSPDPLQALVVQRLLQAEPSLLHAYLDLELIAELAGSEPDSHYLQRLATAAGTPEAALQHWWQAEHQERQRSKALEQQLSQTQTELTNAREEAELTLLQLHQVQEELEAAFLKGKELEQQAEAQAAKVAAQDQELTTLKTQLDAASNERDAAQHHQAALETQLSQTQTELTNAREEAELTLLQLHQVQEELEHYFLETRAFSQVASQVAATAKDLWLQQHTLP